VRAPWNVRRASLTDLLEREIEEVPTSAGQVTLEMRPFQIVTLKLEQP